MMQERIVFICSNPNSIASDKTDMIKWSIEAKKESDNPFVFSLFFPVFPCCSLVLWSMANTSYFCRQKRALRRNTKRNYKQNNNKIMGYFIITDSNWAKLRNEILSLAETCHKDSGNRASIPIGCTMVMCASCLISASVLCSIIGIQACCPLPKSGISAITSVRTWNSCSKPKLRNQKMDKTKINK